MIITVSHPNDYTLTQADLDHLDSLIVDLYGSDVVALVVYRPEREPEVRLA